MWIIWVIVWLMALLVTWSLAAMASRSEEQMAREAAALMRWTATHE